MEKNVFGRITVAIAILCCIAAGAYLIITNLEVVTDFLKRCTERISCIFRSIPALLHNHKKEENT